MLNLKCMIERCMMFITSECLEVLKENPVLLIRSKLLSSF